MYAVQCFALFHLSTLQEIDINFSKHSEVHLCMYRDDVNGCEGCRKNPLDNGN